MHSHAITWTVVAPFVVLGVLWLIYRAATGTWNVYRIAEGYDARTSTSKMQFLLWTIVVIPCYAAVGVANWRTGHVDSSVGVPDNLLIALGLSIGTAAGAKALYQFGGVEKTRKPDVGRGGLLTDDDGAPELAKIQLLAWTLLAIAFFCIRVSDHLQTALGGGGAVSTLPDIDTALLVLMGLGHAGYGSKKVLDRFGTKAPLKEATVTATADTATTQAKENAPATGVVPPSP